MRTLFLILFFYFTFTAFGQTLPDNGFTKKSDTNAERPDFFSEPYLYKHYNPERKDFSKEFYKAFIGDSNKSCNVVKRLKHYNCIPVWLREYCQDGVIGRNYWRIQLKITGIEKDKSNPLLYHITGKSKLRDTINGFSGTLKILRAYEQNSDLDTGSDHPTCGTLYAEYYFSQDSKLPNTGFFSGIEESDYLIDYKHKRLSLDTLFIVADGYFNNTFVGIWKKYNSNDTLKCIWGDNRLPFCFDFDGGAGEVIPNDKYKMNGWQTFGDDEWTVIKDGYAIPKNKWWLGNGNK